MKKKVIKSVFNFLQSKSCVLLAFSNRGTEIKLFFFQIYDASLHMLEEGRPNHSS